MTPGRNGDERAKIQAVHPNIVDVEGMLLPPGRGPFSDRVFPLLNRVPLVRDKGLFPPATWSLTRLRFSDPNASIDSRSG